MSVLESKKTIETAVGEFRTRPLYEAGLGLLDALGYQSDRTLRLSGVNEFLAAFDQSGRLNRDAAKVGDWRDAAFLRQITSEDVSTSGQGKLPFQQDYAPTEMQSYVFVAIELTRKGYTRTELAQITRAVNRVFSMPAMILFKYGDALTLAIIDRRPNRRDATQDVPEKVTLVKDISVTDPLRAHVEILHDLSLEKLHEDFYFHNFAGLHEAWRKRLGGLALSEKFYREVANWYFWAVERDGVILPRSIETIPGQEERKRQRAIFFIRLLTRLIFCWFLQEKGLLPRDLFRERVVDRLLINNDGASGTYYKAFLQNLFFATLNQEQQRRGWRRKSTGSRDGNRGVTNLWRYRDLLTEPGELERLLRDRVPFVNGGLFDCLDDVRDDPPSLNVRLDDFSEESANQLCLPNDLFFGSARDVDLSVIYEDARRKKERVSGLIEILSRYKFTVEENTPLEEEIALDPELLGKVFENLLASYNEDTRTTARKALGAFYTPRQIVNYMVDEALIGYLSAQVTSVSETALRALFDGQSAAPELSPPQRAALVTAISRVKILDPACGSGAFPMGALHRLVGLLQELDPNNESWKRSRLAEAERYYALLRHANAPASELAECESRISDIEHSFDTRYHELDFGRKLYLIENCIYGVDIEPIACQIAKLRFFIALLVDQRVDASAPNLGVRPLPNLETKIVAANFLIGIRRPGQQLLRNAAIDEKEAELRRVRERYFLARTPGTKARYREQDAKLRAEIAGLLEEGGWDIKIGHLLASWDPYNQNAAASFFDPEWMFSLPIGTVQRSDASMATLRGSMVAVNEAGGQMEFVEDSGRESGFDIVIGNPPYVRIQTLSQQDPELVKRYKQEYQSATKGNYDLYVVFVEAGLRFLKPDGHLAYILPHKFFNAQYGEPLRALLAKGRFLQHVVHFGDQQVFPGATNYVCLLFLAKGGVERCRVVRVDHLQGWLDTHRGTEGSFTSQAITSAEWSFSVGTGADLFQMLQERHRKLSDVAARIYQGPITSADPVYVFKEHKEGRSESLLVVSKQLNREVEIESGILKSVIRSGDIGSFWAKSEAVVLFPYRIRGTEAQLYTPQELQSEFPLAWNYLDENRSVLEAREKDSFRDAQWYRFGRTQNLGMWEQPKLMVPYMISRLAAYLDRSDHYYFINVTTGGYGITLRSGGCDLAILCALMNSPVLDFVLKRVSTNFHGGYFAANKQYIERLPIADIAPHQKPIIVQLVEHLLWLNRMLRRPRGASDGSDRDALMLGYLEQALNGLVYELYFPEDLHQRGLNLFDLVEEAGLPALATIPDADRLNRLRSVFESAYDLGHPLRAALHDLQTVEVVRIIEGRS